MLYLLIKFCFRIRASTFLRVSEEIEQVFPNEKQDTYYIPYVASGKKNKKGYGPKGKLWSRYTNVRSALRSANNLKELTLEHPNDKVLNNGHENSDKTSDVENTHLSFLKVATEPRIQVEEAWEQTFKARRRIYFNADLDAIYKEFPCLNQNNGIELVSVKIISGVIYVI